MTDIQVMTLAIAILVPASSLLLGNTGMGNATRADPRLKKLEERG